MKNVVFLNVYLIFAFFYEAINDDSIGHTLKFIEPKLQLHTKLSNDIALLEALHELGVNDEETVNQLSPKYRSLLENEKQLQELYNSIPAYLDRLYGKLLNTGFNHACP